MGTCEQIVRIEGVCGGEPIIRGTRIRVADVVAYKRLLGPSQAIVDALPPLTLEDVSAALDYYDEHRADIERSLIEDEESESWKDIPNVYRPAV